MQLSLRRSIGAALAILVIFLTIPAVQAQYYPYNNGSYPCASNNTYPYNSNPCYGSQPSVYAAGSNANTDSADLFGSVNPNGTATTVWFDYGPNQSFGSQSGYQQAGAGTAQVNVLAHLANLQPGITYYFRVAAQSSYGIQYSSIQTFQTKYPSYTNPGTTYPTYPSNPGTSYGAAPSATTESADHVGTRSATVHGLISPNGSAATAWFEYGTSANPQTHSESRSIAANQISFEINFLMGQLLPGTTYYYRIVAQSAAGITNGTVRSFRTIDETAPAPAPVPTQNPPSGTPAPSAGAPGNLMTLTSSLDKAQVGAGEEAALTAAYQNPAKAGIKNAKLEITLPSNAQYVIATKLPAISGSTYSFDLGNLPAGATGSVILRFKAADGAAGSQTIDSLLTYQNTAGQTSEASAVTSFAFAEASGTPSSDLTASPSSAIAKAWPWWVWVIILILAFCLFVAAYVFYRYNKAKRMFASPH